MRLLRLAAATCVLALAACGTTGSLKSESPEARRQIADYDQVVVLDLAANDLRPARDDVESAAQVLEDEFPMIKAMVYWNDSRAGGFQVRIDQPGEAGTAYGEAYAEFVADPYFDRTSAADAP